MQTKSINWLKSCGWMLIFTFIILEGCNSGPKKGDAKMASDSVSLIMLAPGHFHAALLQKTMEAGVDSTVHVFAPDGPELDAYLALIKQYNSRPDAPTAWKEKVYAGPGFLDSMLREKPGNVVVLAGNNQRKTDYIMKSVAAGLNVLADKPMAITPAGFQELKKAFGEAKEKGVLLYDIMTERYVVTNILQKAFSHMPEVFGTLEAGSAENPSIDFSSVHYFFKRVSGEPLIRPSWYFDVAQQGEGIVDVTTHLVDLIQWECFPDTVLDYERDIRMLSARHWPTRLSPTQFKEVTGEEGFPEFLAKDVKGGILSVYANGVMNYTIKGIHARVSVAWNFEAPKGSGDTYYSVLRGSKATLTIRQGAEQGFKPVLYINPSKGVAEKSWRSGLDKEIEYLHETYPGISLKETSLGLALQIPDKYDLGHEHHFSLVVNQYLRYLRAGGMPQWEISGMLAKYYTTTEALEMAEDSPLK